MRQKARPALLALALVHLTCHQAILTAPGGSTMQIFANPGFIVANGGVAVISVIMIEPAGTPVVDGTVVQFFTTLGRIDEQGKTNDGVARVNLVADSRSGQAKVTAISGAVTATLAPDITIGNVLPARIQVIPNPARILETRISIIRAFVFDANGNTVSNVPVIFTIDGDPSTEFMDSRSAPQFTDNNGVAQDLLRTRYEPAAPPKVITVRATPAGNSALAATTTVTIN